MSPARWRGRLQRLGRPGAAGIGLLACCAAFQLSTVAPAAERLAQLRQDGLALQQALRQARQPQQPDTRSPDRQLVQFYGRFPERRSATDWLARIFQAAQARGLVLAQGDYRLLQERGARLARYRIILPVSGSYPQIRRFINDVLAQVPSAALDSVSFERPRIGDGAVQAKIGLTLYLAGPP